MPRTPQKKMPANHNRLWTPEEVQILYDFAGTMSYEAIAKKVKRTAWAVERKYEKLGYANQKENLGALSKNMLAEILKVDHKVIARWHENYGLPIQHRDIKSAKNKKYKTWFIFAEEFWAWAEQHKDLVNFARIEPKTLLPEPAWVDEERKKHVAKHKSQWTSEEDEILLHMYYKQGIPQKQIALRLNRTVNSIESRIERFRFYHRETIRMLALCFFMSRTTLGEEQFK